MRLGSVEAETVPDSMVRIARMPSAAFGLATYYRNPMIVSTQDPSSFGYTENEPRLAVPSCHGMATITN